MVTLNNDTPAQQQKDQFHPPASQDTCSEWRLKQPILVLSLTLKATKMTMSLCTSLLSRHTQATKKKSFCGRHDAHPALNCYTISLSESRAKGFVMVEQVAVIVQKKSNLLQTSCNFTQFIEAQSGPRYLTLTSFPL